MSKFSQRYTANDLNALVGKEIIVQFNGYRQITGTLENYDDKFNLYINNAVETIRDLDQPNTLTTTTRTMSEVFVKGMSVTDLIQNEGYTQIE
ncbi:LSM domain containing protein [Entamoeba marina]